MLINKRFKKSLNITGICLFNRGIALQFEMVDTSCEFRDGQKVTEL